MNTVDEPPMVSQPAGIGVLTAIRLKTRSVLAVITSEPSIIGSFNPEFSQGGGWCQLRVA